MATGGRVLHHLKLRLARPADHSAAGWLSGGRHPRSVAAAGREYDSHSRPGHPGSSSGRDTGWIVGPCRPRGDFPLAFRIPQAASADLLRAWGGRAGAESCRCLAGALALEGIGGPRLRNSAAGVIGRQCNLQAFAVQLAWLAGFPRSSALFAKSVACFSSVTCTPKARQLQSKCDPATRRKSGGSAAWRKRVDDLKG